MIQTDVFRHGTDTVVFENFEKDFKKAVNMLAIQKPSKFGKGGIYCHILNIKQDTTSSVTVEGINYIGRESKIKVRVPGYREVAN